MFKTDDSNVASIIASTFAKNDPRRDFYCAAGGTGSNPAPNRDKPRFSCEARSSNLVPDRDKLRVSCVVRNGHVFVVESNIVTGEINRQPKGMVHRLKGGIRRKQDLPEGLIKRQQRIK